MSRRFSYSLIIFSATAVSPVWAQEGNFCQRSPVPKFSLSASMHDSILRREDKVQENSSLLNTPASAAVQKPISPDQRAGQIAPGNAIPQNIPLSNLDRPNSYMQEYQVNWSPWVGHLASDWHQILKGCEEVMGLQFHTVRPALIQFTCYADGRIGNIMLRQSSGIPAYDRLQIAALMEVRPLPFPAGTARGSVTLIQGWESHTKRPGEEEFKPWNFASQFPQERVSKWIPAQ